MVILPVKIVKLKLIKIIIIIVNCMSDNIFWYASKPKDKVKLNGRVFFSKCYYVCTRLHFTVKASPYAFLLQREYRTQMLI